MLIRLFVGAMTAFFLAFPGYLIETSIVSKPKKQKEAVEKAIKSGNVVTAVLKKVRATTVELPGVQKGWSRVGYYEYEYNGKRYRYNFRSDNPPQMLTLYFLKNPARATVDLALLEYKVNWPLVAVVIAAVVALLSGR